MPELPEVETTMRGIASHVIGRTVVAVLVRQAKLRWPVSPELGQLFTGQEICSVSRRAKYLFLESETGRVMIHLGMSGSLRILTSDLQAGKHDHVDFVFDNRTTLRFHDPRRFGSIFWLMAGEGHTLLDALGPEPLAEEFNADHLFSRSRNKKVAVKQFIMNAHNVVGVGNIYANEALFMAGIRPDRSAGTISYQRCRRLTEAIKQVLTAAIRAGGTTLKDFVREDGNPGYFKQSLAVYGRGGLPCNRCGRVLKEERLGQRATVFCTRCQR
ncbi:MAG: bifunctional DNA-formamidopyrimidine glycosylase/DNA-(apurinic or apyrimidinic site) lyase [Pseudomonadales bacterium]|nr:bifunctional DNA-formamidopyrimidine glycosylase/DNA-(apurinic or apyrimidinic site) lyase [Pseudomonadales bacterium]